METLEEKLMKEFKTVEELMKEFKTVDEDLKKDIINHSNYKITKKVLYEQLAELTIAESRYLLIKQKYTDLKNEKMINTNWNKINEQRELAGLDKLTSDTKKKAYVDTLLNDFKFEVVNQEIIYEYMKRLYNQTLLINQKQEDNL